MSTICKAARVVTMTTDAELDDYLAKRYSPETLADWARQRDAARKAHQIALRLRDDAPIRRGQP